MRRSRGEGRDERRRERRIRSRRGLASPIEEALFFTMDNNKVFNTKGYKTMRRVFKMRSILCVLLMITAGAIPAAQLFLEDFKDGGASFGDGYFIANGDGVNVDLRIGNELLELVATETVNGTAYAIEYPESGSITWDTAQNRYLQAWIPTNGKGDATAVQFSVDGGAFQGDVWGNRIDALTSADANTRPAPIDVNALAGLSSGVHQLRFRFVFFTSEYSPLADQAKLEATVDWIRGGMAPGAQANVGACGFVGPTDNELTNNPPTLQWSAPAGGAASYILSYSQDPQFRGESTVTVHNIATTSYTPAAPLAQGKWYWTVMAVNSDDIAGLCLVKSIGGSGDWRAPYDYNYYSFWIGEEPPEYSAPFFEDFKDGGARFGAQYFQQGDGLATITFSNDTMEVSGRNTLAWSSYGIEYPAEGAITWDTTKNRYLQVWVPYTGDSDHPTVQFSVDGGAWTPYWPEIAGLTDQENNTRPNVIDVNYEAELGQGIYQLRFRFLTYTDPYAWIEADQYEIEASWDWIRAGMAPNAQTSVGTCGFVGPADGQMTSNPPTLQWSAPAGGAAKYIVSYSQDPHFRGPTTVTVHDVMSTSYTPPAGLDGGTWYWTVMAVNSDNIAGYCLPKGLDPNGLSGGTDWRAPYDYVFYSFTVPGVNAAGNWSIYR